MQSLSILMQRAPANHHPDRAGLINIPTPRTASRRFVYRPKGAMRTPALDLLGVGAVPVVLVLALVLVLVELVELGGDGLQYIDDTQR